jgi:energy-coupling factor transport system substrate-specific component
VAHRNLQPTMVRKFSSALQTRWPDVCATGVSRDFYPAILAVMSLTGLFVFLLPFLLSAVPNELRQGLTRPAEASLLMGLVMAGTLFVILGDLTHSSVSGGLSRSIALLAVLVSIDATLRLFPSFLGASPIFALVILVGSEFGPRFGFAMGSLTLLISAVITAGIGPWLPFQMLCAGWVGLGAGLLRPSGKGSRQVAFLGVYGAVAGILFGVLMNLYSWPLATPASTVDVGLYWSPELSVTESLARYGAFYLATSLLHDTTRAVGNVILISVAGAPVLRLLQRFRIKSTWQTADAKTGTAGVHLLQPEATPAEVGT